MKIFWDFTFWDLLQVQFPEIFSEWQEHDMEPWSCYLHVALIYLLRLYITISYFLRSQSMLYIKISGSYFLRIIKYAVSGSYFLRIIKYAVSGSYFLRIIKYAVSGSYFLRIIKYAVRYNIRFVLLKNHEIC